MTAKFNDNSCQNIDLTLLDTMILGENYDSWVGCLCGAENHRPVGLIPFALIQITRFKPSQFIPDSSSVANLLTGNSAATRL